MCYSCGVPRSLVAALAAALAFSSVSTALADIEGDRFESSAWRVRMTAPKNWQLTEKTAYPNILLRMSRRAPDGKMLLSAERLAPGATALVYAQRTGDLLRQMGFQVRSPQLHSSTGAYFVDCESRGAFLRQAFLVTGGVGYSLTLSAPDYRTRSQHLRAFDYALRSLQILRPGEGEPPPAETPAQPSSGQAVPTGQPPPPDQPPPTVTPPGPASGPATQEPKP